MSIEELNYWIDQASEYQQAENEAVEKARKAQAKK